MILLSSVVDAFDSKLKQRYSHRLLPGHKRALGAVPRELRPLAFAHQRLFYDALMSCAWQTINQFSENDKELRGRTGAIAVLHTHSRRLDFHPHVHLVVPAAAINERDRHWRTRTKSGYLFSKKALACVFRAKLLSSLREKELCLPSTAPSLWVVDILSVGRGDKAITYLGKYLYRGVMREKDIVSMDGENVTYRYTKNTGQVCTRTMKRSIRRFSNSDAAVTLEPIRKIKSFEQSVALLNEPQPDIFSIKKCRGSIEYDKVGLVQQSVHVAALRDITLFVSATKCM